MSQTDALTGLDNRRYLEERMEEMFGHARRFKEPFALVMCDLDRFKSVNDTYGHQAGDVVLKQFARILKDEAREIDRVGRYGGEEFMLLLPGTVLDAAVTFAERVRKAVEAHTFTFGGRRLRARRASAWRHGRIRGSEDCDALVRAADDALYVAKETGRNRVVRFDSEEFNEHQATNDGSDEPTRRSAIERCSAPTQASVGELTIRGWRRGAELQRERDQLVAVVDILQDISSSLHFVDILQAIARKLGETFGLDRCSIFLVRRQRRCAPRGELRGPVDPEPRRRSRSVPGAQARVRVGRHGIHPRCA